MAELTRAEYEDMAKKELCYYCGAAANTIDHVVPKSTIRMYYDLDPDLLEDLLRGRKLEVRCCHECNVLLGATIQDTLADRKKLLKSKLKKRYAKLLKSPDWEEEEISAMGEHMQQHIREGIKKKEYIKERIVW